MIGSATIFQVPCSAPSVTARRLGRKYLFSLRATRTFSCSGAQIVTRSLDDFLSKRKVEPTLFQVYLDVQGEHDRPEKWTIKLDHPLEIIRACPTCPTPELVWCGRRDLNSRINLFG